MLCSSAISQQRRTRLHLQKVIFEAGIDGIKLGVDGVDVGAVLKFTRASGDGDVLTLKGSVAANGESTIYVTHRNDHFITIYSQKGLHCENMPTKVGRSVDVKDDVYVREFRVETEDTSRGFYAKS